MSDVTDAAGRPGRSARPNENAPGQGGVSEAAKRKGPGNTGSVPLNGHAVVAAEMSSPHEAMADRLRLFVPRELWGYRQWLVWRYEPGRGKPRKVPHYAASGACRAGTQGDPADLAQLATFEQAEARFRAGGFDGVGVAVLATSPVKAIDLDGCVDPRGNVTAQAQEIFAKAGSYSEISPSGTGVRILVSGELPSAKAMNRFGPGQHLELFGTSGYVTITGHHMEESPAAVRPMTQEFKEWLCELAGASAKTVDAVHIEPDAPMASPRRWLDCLAALNHIKADDRDIWVKVGMAIHNERPDDAGLDAYTQWSATSPKYDEKDLARVWRGFKRRGASGVTLNTVFELARQQGWKALQAPQEAAQQHEAPEARATSLLMSDKGAILACEHNAFELLATAERYEALHFDEFLSRMRFGDCDWIDADDLDTVRWLQCTHHVARFNLGHARNAARSLAYSRRRDSLREFVQALPVWDGVARIDQAFADAWGAPDSELMRAASANFFIALIARALQPGAQVDTLWTFEGPQGSFKSLSLRALGGVFHAEISAPIGTADFQREMRGLWLAELSELDSLRGKEASTIKRLLSAPTDRFVQKYENHAQTYPRRAVAVATTNEANYWQDSTGARRLVPIPCGEIRIDLISTTRLQWFAEARQRRAQGAAWWEFPTSILAEQDNRQQGDPWEDILRDCMVSGRKTLNGRREDWPAGAILTATITRDWLRLEPHQQGQATSTRIGKVMRRLGFEQTRVGKGGERAWKPADT